MKNSADQGGCFRPRWKTPSEFWRILHILRKPNSIIQNIFPFLKEFHLFALCFSVHQNNTTWSPGFLGQWFNNLQRAALLTSYWHHWFNMTKLLTSLVQHDKVHSKFGRQQLVMMNYACGFERMLHNTQQLWVAYMQEHCWKYYILLHFHFGLAIRFAWGTFKGFENAVQPLVNGHPYQVVSNQSPREGSSNPSRIRGRVAL